jgi:DMSO/TMAO reductase YedYZ molybdopterin-dependent catalytic subunit
MSAKANEARSVSIWSGAAIGALATLALCGLLALSEPIFGTTFIPFDIFDWMARVLPGGLIRFVIASMVAVIRVLQGSLPIGDISTAAKLAEQAIAVLQFITAGAAFGALLAWLRRSRPIHTFGQAGGLVLLALTLVVESALGLAIGLNGLVLALLFVGWGFLIARLIDRSAQLPAAAEGQQLSRRQFLAVSGASLAVTALGAWGVSKLFGESAMPPRGGPTAVPVSGDDPFGAALTSGPAASPSPAELAARTAPVGGTRPELTANEDFYRIDINTRPPEVDESNWRLQVLGLVDTPLNLTLAELRAMPAQTQILTMQCISNPVGGDLTGSSRWTGVRFADVLERAGVQAAAIGAHITSTDGFYEFVTMEDIQDERCLLVYEMNGEPLPYEHGFPLRVYVPNRYGMKQPKWIEQIELVADRVEGYWVHRGWDREAIVNTVSVIDTVVVDPDQGENGMATCGGIAWASARGISKVEVKVDGEDWAAAELIEPPLSPLNWVLWRYAFPYEMGRHTVQVRAYDSDGKLQAIEDAPPAPSGATGIHNVVVTL